MAIPNYQEFMLPTLEVIADGQEHKNSYGFSDTFEIDFCFS